jgi:DNA primase
MHSLTTSPFQIADHVDFDRNGRAYCPSCLERKGRQPSQKSLALLQSGAYKCHAGCTPEQIRESLGVPLRSNVGGTQSFSSSYQLTPEQVNQAMDTLLQGDSSDAQAARTWLMNRSISPALIRHYRLGLNRENGLTGIQIPIPADGLQFYRKVRIAPWLPDTAWSQKGLTAMVYFSHQPPQTSKTYLCEGEWDAILLGWMLRDNPDIAVATFTCGCNVVPKPDHLQRLPGQVVIFYDRDEPGRLGAQKVAQTLGERAKIAQVPCSLLQTPVGWDITDALNAGCPVTEIHAAAGTALGQGVEQLPSRKTKGACLPFP